MTAWLDTARALTGTLEVEGDGDNPTILAWAAEIGRLYPEMANYCAQYRHDAIPWCGLFVAYCAAKNGVRPVFGPADTDKFLWARAWEQAGAPVSGQPQPGDVLVFDGHVTFYDGEEGGNYLCRGGNQHDSVNVTPFAKSRVIAVRRLSPSLAAPSALPIPTIAVAPKRFTGITATVFGGQSDPNYSAYDNHFISDAELGVALPFRFVGVRPRVRVWNGSRSVECDIVDVGPWNIADPYWTAAARPQAESGTDRTGRTTNLSGIDLTPAAAAAIGLDGKGRVDWEFITTPAVVDDATLRKESQKLVLVDWVRKGAQTVITAVSGWAATAQITDKQSLFNMGAAISLLVMAGFIWYLMNKIDKMVVKDYKEGRYVPSGASALPPPVALPPAAKDLPMNPALIATFAPILQQILGGVIGAAMAPPQPANVPPVVPVVPPPVPTVTPPGDGTMETFLKNLLKAIIIAAAAEVMKELPNLVAKAKA